MNSQLGANLANKELREIEGVQFAKVSFKDGTVQVISTPSLTSQSLIQAIDKLHYHVSILSEN